MIFLIFFLLCFKDKIHLKTIEWFAPSKCHEERLVTLNSFDKKLNKWNKKFIVPEKFKNYHNCTMLLFSKIFRLGFVDQAIMNFFPLPFPQLYEAAEKRDVIERNFIEIFAQRGNYQIELADLYNEEKHMQHFTLIFREFLDAFHFGSDFYEECYLILLSPPQKYTSYEKLTLPFDIASWIGILIYFVIAFIVIIITRLKSRKFYNLMVGENVKSPCMNLIVIFFGGSMTSLPNNNFGRIILTAFIYFCLIIRTGYQGELKTWP